MNMEIIINILGCLGAIALLVAYAGVSAGWLGARTLLYQVLNLGGSAFLVVNSAWYRAFPSAFVNVVWIAVAIFSLAALSRRASRSGPRSRDSS